MGSEVKEEKPASAEGRAQAGNDAATRSKVCSFSESKGPASQGRPHSIARVPRTSRPEPGPGGGEDRVEHLLGEAPGEGVLLARVVRADENGGSRLHLPPVGEARAGARG